MTERRTGAKPAATRRTTPKGTAPKGSGTDNRVSSGRYTPPIPKEMKVSPRWVPVLMFTLLVLGAATIVLNYMGVLPTESGEASNWYLLLGLGFITGGFIAATQYR